MFAIANQTTLTGPPIVERRFAAVASCGSRVRRDPWKRGQLGYPLRINGNNVFGKFYIGPDQNLGPQRQINVSHPLSFK